MNLICPHCQKQVSVADTLAGLTTNCPQCQGPFTVPIPPSAPPPPSPPPLSGPAAYAPSPSTIPLREEAPPRPPPPLEALPPPPSLEPIPGYEPPPPPIETGDYRYRSTLYFRPQVIQWIAPVCFFLIFLLMLFPWVGAYVGSTGLVTQTGLGLAFGSYSEYERDYFKEQLWKLQVGLGGSSILGGQAPEEKPPSLFAPLTLFYFIIVLLGIFAAIAFLVLPNVNPELAARFVPWRSLAIGGISILAFLFLLLQLLVGFPLENRVVARADKSFAKAISAARDQKDAKTARDLEIERARFEGLFQNRPALRLVLLLNLVAVIASLIDFWLERRVGRPAPRLLFES